MDIHGLRTADVSRKTGLPQATLRYILQGLTDNPRIETVIKLADCFDVSIDYLLGRKEEEPTLMLPGRANLESTIRIPVLEWKSAPYWVSHQEATLPANHEHWLPSNPSLSAKSFALWTTYEGRGIFPKNSYILIDPEYRFEVDDYVISALDENKPAIKRIWQEGATQYLNPIGGNTPAHKIQNRNEIIGTIVENRIPFAPAS